MRAYVYIDFWMLRTIKNVYHIEFEESVKIIEAKMDELIQKDCIVAGCRLTEPISVAWDDNFLIDIEYIDKPILSKMNVIGKDDSDDWKTTPAITIRMNFCKEEAFLPLYSIIGEIKTNNTNE